MRKQDQIMAMLFIGYLQHIGKIDWPPLQHIGKIDWPPKVVIFLHICNFGKIQIISMYQ
jgi:hypothetical protein